MLKAAIKRFFKLFCDSLKYYKIAVLIGIGVAVLAGASLGIYFAITSMSKIFK